MPGVPSSRGCEACRLAKKKCDQARPSCLRCTRLELACVGSGERRFKFCNQSLAFPAAHDRALRRGGNSRQLSTLRIHVPSNETTVTTAALISVLDVTDPGYDVGSIGRFTRDLPRRLGRSPALDASVTVFVSAFQDLRRRNTMTVASRKKYISALKAVRGCFDSEETAYSIDTLCAVYLISAAEPWLALPGEPIANHGRGMAILLQHLLEVEPVDEFSKSIIQIVSLIVILNSIFARDYSLEPWIDKIPSSGTRPSRAAVQDGYDFWTLYHRHLAMLPGIIRDPRRSVDHVEWFYNMVRIDRHNMKRLGDDILEQQRAGPAALQAAQLAQAETFYEAGLCVLLWVGLTLNAFLLRKSGGGGDDDDEETQQLLLLLLEAERHGFCADAIRLSDRAQGRRPVAAEHLPVCLVAAWLCSDDGQQQVEIEKRLDDYQRDYGIIGCIRETTRVHRDERTGRVRKLPRFPCGLLQERIQAEAGTSALDRYCAEYCCIL